MKTNNGNILVVGGYGVVGRVVCGQLAQIMPKRIIAAGRDLRKAQQFAAAMRDAVMPLCFNPAADSLPESVWKDLGTVIVCVDLPNANFAAECSKRGVNYVDITADIGSLRKIEALDDVAKKSGAVGILSVGLAPGLTNLLAKECCAALDVVHRCDIFIQLGLGEAHGEAAIRWTIANLNRRFSILEAGQEKCVQTLGEGKPVKFDQQSPVRTAYRFDFSDQHVIPKTIGVPSASTWLCFDNSFTGWSFACCSRFGLLRIADTKIGREALVKIFKTVHWGSDEFKVKAEATGVLAGKSVCRERTVTGRVEGRTTGLIAAEVARKVHQNGHRQGGVFHVEQIFSLEQLLASPTFADLHLHDAQIQPLVEK